MEGERRILSGREERKEKYEEKYEGREEGKR